MIEINLIPDVKQEMIRAQKMRNVAISISIMTALAAGAIVAVLGVLVGLQTLHENLARDQIKKEFSKLQSTSDIENALTIQSQLKTISELNNKKTIDSRLFDVVAAISPAAPNDIKYSTIRLDPATKTLTIEATAANSYLATDMFRKLILNTKVESGESDKIQTVPLTDDVRITDASYGENSDGAKILSFKASFIYPEGLFDNTLSSVKIVTPTTKVDVTESRTRIPAALFGEAPKPATKEANP